MNIHSLRFKIALVLFCIFIITFLIHVFLVMPVLQKRGIESETDYQRSLAKKIVLHVDFWLQQGKSELESIAALPAMIF